jgi:hypothetical protein
MISACPFCAPARAAAALLLCLTASGTAAASAESAIHIDGRLDETVWAQAQRIDDFRTVQPLTRAVPEWRTEVRVLAREDGLYFGLRAEQPPGVPRTRHPTRRDAQARADRFNVMIDFEGEGSTAYEFTVSLSDGIQDAIITGQNNYRYDWDGVWQHAVAEDEAGWTAELRLPWGIAPVGRIDNGRTRIGLYLSRVIEQAGLRFSHPHYDFENPTFVADMARLEVAAWNPLKLEVVPYVSVADDRLAGRSERRAGADLYLARGVQRLNATLQPDFGQVESDALVVDFSAIEVFFSEKRPFFTENHALFDVPLGNGGLLINTRRIGAAPDAGEAGVSEIEGALKYTGSFGNADLGAMWASEEDSAQALGREFRVLRGRWRQSSGEYGLSFTETLRPSLDRQAQTTVADALWRPIEGLQLRAAAGQARIDEDDAERDGGFAWLRMDHVLGPRWRQEYEASRYGRGLELNDLGYLPRADLTQLRAEHTWYTRSHAADSRLRNSYWEGELLHQANADGDRLHAGLRLVRGWQFVSADSLTAQINLRAPFVDDLVLRGNGRVHLPAQHSASLRLQSRRLGAWRFDLGGWLYQQGLSGWTRELQFTPTWFIGERFTGSLTLALIDGSDWLVWDGGNRLGRYAQRRSRTDWTLEWFPRPRHEVRLRAQYVGLRAEAFAGYAVDAQGRLQPASTPVDFSLGTLAAQLRYRYQFDELRDFYLVLSRGGDYFGEDADARGMSDLFDRTRKNETANQILAKLRWGF